VFTTISVKTTIAFSSLK